MLRCQTNKEAAGVSPAASGPFLRVDRSSRWSLAGAHQPLEVAVPLGGRKGGSRHGRNIAVETCLCRRGTPRAAQRSRPGRSNGQLGYLVLVHNVLTSSLARETPAPLLRPSQHVRRAKSTQFRRGPPAGMREEPYRSRRRAASNSSSSSGVGAATTARRSEGLRDTSSRPWTSATLAPASRHTSKAPM